MGSYNIAVLPGDGIGPEVTAAAVQVLHAAVAAFPGLQLNFHNWPCGAGEYLQSGHDLPQETLAGAAAADAVLLGAMGLPDVRRSDGTELAPQVELRIRLDLYGGVRPVRGFRGLPRVLTGVAPEEIDFVVVRESTEGAFASMHRGIVLRDEVAADTSIITRTGTERVCRAAFEIARRRAGLKKRPGRVTCVDKANVFRGFAFFRSIFDEIAAGYADVVADHCYIDAAAFALISRPRDWDVLVTENLFGDILSDLGPALIGGLGLAPSADIGDSHAVFQPTHGTAPDLAGQGVANPIAAILSGAMMLDWLAQRHEDSVAAAAGRAIAHAVEEAVGARGCLTPDLGGSAGTGEMAAQIAGLLRRSEAAERPEQAQFTVGDPVCFSPSGEERVRGMPEAWGLHRALTHHESGIVVETVTDGPEPLVTVEFESGSAHYWPATCFIRSP